MECEIEKLPAYVQENVCRIWEEAREGSKYSEACAFYRGLANGSHANSELFLEAIFLVFVAVERFKLANELED